MHSTAAPFVSGSFVLIALVAVAGACGQSPSDVRREPIPPPGPHFSVVPLRLETVAHISPIGSNNKVFPTAHTYWHTCDVDGFGTRPCHLERQQLFAPDWEAITPASGAVAIRLWNPTLGFHPNFDWPGGTLLLELVDSTALRMEWFDTHEPVAGFATAVKTYVR